MHTDHGRVSTRRAAWLAAAAGALLGLLGGTAFAALSSPPYQVTQKGRAFRPGDITIQRGDVVQFVNDDGDLLHHAYLSDDSFNFDSGDQAPGSRTDIIFTTSGTFTVLCGIHPKMKLVVHVN